MKGIEKLLEGEAEGRLAAVAARGVDSSHGQLRLGVLRLTCVYETDDEFHVSVQFLLSLPLPLSFVFLILPPFLSGTNCCRIIVLYSYVSVVLVSIHSTQVEFL